jgi:hypothetical protein
MTTTATRHFTKVRTGKRPPLKDQPFKRFFQAIDDTIIADTRSVLQFALDAEPQPENSGTVQSQKESITENVTTSTRL